MIKIDEIIIVEGKYDKIKLKNFIDGVIIETNGFRIFKDKKKQQMIKELSKTKDILVVTDSDSAGFMIRNFLKSIIPTEKIKNVYMPEILGKEKRKTQQSKEGLLGVEGISDDIIIKCLEKYLTVKEPDNLPKITKAILFADGFSGFNNSKTKREILLKKLDLPKYLSVNSMIDILNTLINFDEYKELIAEVDNEIKVYKNT